MTNCSEDDACPNKSSKGEVSKVNQAAKRYTVVKGRTSKQTYPIMTEHVGVERVLWDRTSCRKSSRTDTRTGMAGMGGRRITPEYGSDGALDDAAKVAQCARAVCQQRSWLERTV